MSLSLVLSTCRSKYTPGERTSWLTTTRSVPLMMKVPLADMSGKSPMNTVWLLISPVVLLMNSAVTNMVPEKSSIGLISSKISSRPDCSDKSFRPASFASLMRACHLSLPSSQSNDSVCRASRSGTLSGSWIRAKETRREPEFAAEVVDAEALRDAANRGPSELVAELSPHARQTPRGKTPERRETPRTSECSANGQCSQRLHCLSTVRQYVVHLAPQHPLSATKRQAKTAWFGLVGRVMDATRVRMCKRQQSGYHSYSRPKRRRTPRTPRRPQDVPGGVFSQRLSARK